MRRTSKLCAGLAAVIVSATTVVMAVGATPAGAAVGGSGPYPADYETSASLANHTIFRPQTLPSERLPIFVWGNGGCSANGLSQGNFLREIASHGFLAIANGAPNGSGSTTSQMLTQSIDWAVAENSRQGSKYYNKLDTTKVAVAGFSCGGLEAYAVSNDPRVTTTGIFSSGLLNDADDYQLRRLTKPIAYFIGGPSDIAYPNAMDDWGKLPAGLPAFMGNLNVGHGGTYDQPNGGEFGRVAVLYLKWRLKGDTTAGANFVGANCGLCRSQWTVQQKNLTLDGPPPTTPPPTTPPPTTPPPTTPRPPLPRRPPPRRPPRRRVGPAPAPRSIRYRTSGTADSSPTSTSPRDPARSPAGESPSTCPAGRRSARCGTASPAAPAAPSPCRTRATTDDWPRARAPVSGSRAPETAAEPPPPAPAAETPTHGRRT